MKECCGLCSRCRRRVYRDRCPYAGTDYGASHRFCEDCLMFLELAGATDPEEISVINNNMKPANGFANDNWNDYNRLQRAKKELEQPNLKEK